MEKEADCDDGSGRRRAVVGWRIAVGRGWRRAARRGRRAHRQQLVSAIESGADHGRVCFDRGMRRFAGRGAIADSAEAGVGLPLARTWVSGVSLHGMPRFTIFLR